MLTDALERRFEEIVGRDGILRDPAAIEPYVLEWRGLYRGSTPLVLMPASTAEVSGVLALCQAENIGVVPQGGNTGLVGGGVPRSTPDRPELVLSMRRLARLRELDPLNYTLVAEAGCVLASLQAAAAEAGRLFPLSLAAEGSCQLGGNIATNAGGTNVLRYGNTRDLVLGLEVVLPNGQVLDLLRKLRKDNTGYDLKQLFIGAEGTLGVITAAACKLYPLPRSTGTAILGMRDLQSVIHLYSEARSRLGDELTAFEAMNALSVDMVIEHVPGTRRPLDERYPWLLLIELSSARASASAETELQGFLAWALERGLVEDAIVAQSGPQRDALWRIRHHISDAQKHEGASIKHDVSVPVTAVPEFCQRAEDVVARLIPGIRLVAFGHVGDGNVHFNLSQPVGMEASAFLDRWAAIAAEVHGVAMALGGSFSAEHGIGLLKTGDLARWRSAPELALMRAIKVAVDPAGIMNPGKLLPG